MKAMERLEEMLNAKDAELEELRGKLQEAEQKLENDSNWYVHREFAAGTEPNPELPIPRLEVRWEPCDDGRYGAAAVYSLVYRHLLGHVAFVPLGITRTTGALADRVRDGGVVDLPFRDGAHFANEMRQLSLRGFAIVGDVVTSGRRVRRTGCAWRVSARGSQAMA
jgi:hypothetical protein